MSDTRLGCYYCFRTLYPQDKQDELRAFVKCSQCGVAYHAVCWHHCGQCLVCGTGQAQPLKVAPPAPLQSVIRSGTLPIEAPALAYAIGKTGIVMPDVIHKHTPSSLHGYELLILIVTVGILVMCPCCSCLVTQIVSRR